MNTSFTLNRRGFLQALGSLTLSFAVPLHPAIAQAPAKLPGDLKTAPMLSAWLRINADGTVTLMVGKVELGQGILTAVTQICADELDVNLERINIISGERQPDPNQCRAVLPLCSRHPPRFVRFFLAWQRQSLVIQLKL
jgi:nicotinate dehydrogenase subunit B